MLAVLPVFALAAPIPEDAVVGTIGSAQWRTRDVEDLGFSPDGTAVWAIERAPWMAVADEAGRGHWGAPRVRAFSAADGTPLAPPTTSDGWLIDADGHRFWTRAEAPPAAPGPLAADGGIALFQSPSDRRELLITDLNGGAGLGSFRANPHDDVGVRSAVCRTDGCAMVDIRGRAQLWRPGSGVTQPGAPDGSWILAATLTSDARLILASEHEIALADGGAYTCRVPFDALPATPSRYRPSSSVRLAVAPDDRTLVVSWPGSGGILVVDLEACAVIARPVPEGDLRVDGEGWAIASRGWTVPIDRDGAPAQPVRDADDASDLPAALCDAAAPVAVSPDGGTCVSASDTAVSITSPGREPTYYALADLARRPDRDMIHVQPQAVAVDDGGASAVVVADVTWQGADGFENDVLAWVLHPDGEDRVVPHVPEHPLVAVAGDLLVAAGWAGVGFYGPDGAFLVAADLPGEVRRVLFAPDERGVVLVGDRWLAFYAIDAGDSGHETGRWDVPAGVSDLAWGPREIALRTDDGGLVRLDPAVLLR